MKYTQEQIDDLLGGHCHVVVGGIIRQLLQQRAELLEALKKCRFDSLNMSLEDWRFVQAAITRADAEIGKAIP